MDYVLDPELAAVAAALPKLELSDLASARAAQRVVLGRLPNYQPRIPLSVKDIAVENRWDTAAVTARVYALAERQYPGPALLYLHGGAYVMGSLSMADATAPMLAEEAGVTVVAVDYRLAPEHPYPAGLEDSYAVLQWSVDKDADYGIDPDRVGVLGESAGGGLAAALARAAGWQRRWRWWPATAAVPGLAAQFLEAPTIDDRLDSVSMTTLFDTPAWQSVNSPYSWRYYLQGIAEPGSVNVPIYAAPARASPRQRRRPVRSSARIRHGLPDRSDPRRGP